MTLPLLAPVLGIAPPNPDIDVDDALITAQIWTLAEIDLLAELDAFTPHPIVEDVRRRYETPATTRGELIDAYDVTDEDNVDHLDDLFDAGLALSDEVVRSMDPLPDPLIDRIDAGDTRFLDPNPWLDGLTDLLLRDGLPPDGPRELGDRQAIVRLLDELTGVPSELGNGPSDAPTPAPVVGPEPTTAPAPDPDPPPSAPETSAVPPTAGETTDGIADRPEGGQTTDAEATGGPADAPDGQTTDAEATGGPADAPDGQTTDVDADAGGSSPSLGLVATLAVGALVLAGVLVAALRSRRREDRAARSPSPSRQAPGRLDDLLDTSRRMTAALDSQEVQRIAVRDGIRLTRAEAGAFLAAGAEPRFAEAIPPRFFSEQPVTEGLLRRVLETGRATSATTDDEPSLVQLPMALAAVPVIAGGGVAGALVVLRSPSEPFSSDEVELLGQLGPIVGSALSAAEEHRSAVTDAERDGLTTLL
ncbi:MAG: GAF domain-containing protein, partial [Actinomycetota bacterium]